MQTNAPDNQIAKHDELRAEATYWREKALEFARLMMEIDRLEEETHELRRANQGREVEFYRTQVAVLSVELASVTHALRALEWAVNRQDGSGDTLANYWADCEVFSDEMTRFDH